MGNKKHKLVATHTGEHITPGNKARQRLTNLLDHLISHSIAPGIINILEVIKVDNHQGTTYRLIVMEGQIPADGLNQQLSIGQTRKTVIIVIPGRLLPGLDAWIADIFIIDDNIGTVINIAGGQYHIRGANFDIFE